MTSEESIPPTPKNFCRHQRACLHDENHCVCPVIRATPGGILLVDPKDNIICPNRHYLVSTSICTCPVRLDRYRKTGK